MPPTCDHCGEPSTHLLYAGPYKRTQPVFSSPSSASMDAEYPPARRPTEREWLLRATFLREGLSVSKTAFLHGCERREVELALIQCRWWLQDMGYNARYAKAKRTGFSDADARLHADQEAEFNLRSFVPDRR